MIPLIKELAFKVPKNEVLLVGFLILVLHQALKYYFHETSFYYNKEEVSFWKTFSTIGGELSIVSISIIASSLISKSGVISSCKNPGFWALVTGISILMVGIISVILIHKAYSRTDFTGLLFCLRKYLYTAGSEALGLLSIVIAIHCC